MSILRSRRQSVLAGGVVAIVTVFMFAVSASASIPPGTQFLPGDNFEIDGNKAVDSTANTDWASSTVVVATAADLTKSQQDNSFGQGTKEDTPVPTVVAGSIPPNKSDFSEFQAASREAANGDTLLYLDWTRSNVLGSADMDFELNQSSQTSSNNVTPVRTQGDLLITYDFASGAKNVSIHIATWNGGASSGSWSALTSLNSNQAVASIADSLLFGELAIDLEAAGIFTSGACESFSQGYVKSRASDSFTSELKDFIAPAPVHVTNCGRIVINKVDADTGQPVAGATFSVTPGQVVNGGQQTSSPVPEVSPGVFCIDKMLIGQTYTVTELTPPPGFDLPPQTSQQVTVNNTLTCGDPLGTPDLTFSDPAHGAIVVHKTAKSHSAGGEVPLPGATFELLDSSGNIVGVTQLTDMNGNACFSNLSRGTYTVREVSAPFGYRTAGDSSVQVTTRGDCASPSVTVPKLDIPLSKIEIIFTSEAGDSITAGTITCAGLTPDSGSTASDASFSDLVPGTYNCTVDIDP